MQLINVIKSYNEKNILNNIQLTFNKCGLVFITGQSGSGKSTLLNILGMFDADYQGNLSIDNQIVDKSENNLSNFRSKLIAFVFQEFNLINSLSVKENILVSLKLSSTEFNYNKYIKTMRQLGVFELENRRVDTLSGGEKQRIAIARAILRENKIILADEPTGNLDEENSEIIMKFLREISRDRLIIIVSHNLLLADKYADRIIHIKNTIIDKDQDKGYSGNKINDIQINKNKVKLGLRWYLFLAKNNFLLRKKKLIPIIISMSIALLCLGSILGFYSGMKNLLNDVNQSILESDLVVVGNYSNGFIHAIDNNLYKNITASVNCNKIMAYYDTKVKLKYNGKAVNSELNVIDYSDFYKNRLKDINGKYINKIDEIIINNNLSKDLFNKENCIGKEIMLSTSTGFQYKCVIVGISNQIDNENNNKIYISKDLNVQMSKNGLLSELIIGYVNEDVNNNVMCKVQTFSNNQKLVSGSKFNDTNDILINASGFNYILTKISPQYSPLSIENINEGKIPNEILNSVLNKEITLQGLDLISFAKVKISGICTELQPSNSLVLYATKETVELYNHPKINKINLYLHDYSIKGRNMATSTFDAKSFSYELPSDKTGSLIMLKVSVIGIVLIIIAIIVTLLSCLMIHFSVKVNVMDRTYEVGVLKSLGATNKNIFRIFVLDNIALGLFLSIISCILIILFNITNLTDLFSFEQVVIYRLEIWHFIPIIFLSCFITILSGLKETVMISRLSIIDAIRYKNM